MEALAELSREIEQVDDDDDGSEVSFTILLHRSAGGVF